MAPDEFKSKYLHTLQTDSTTSQTYIKLPIVDLNELAYFQTSLLECIGLLSQLEQTQYNHEQMQGAMYWLSRLLLVGYPQTEMDGLEEWLINDDIP